MLQRDALGEVITRICGSVSLSFRRSSGALTSVAATADGRRLVPPSAAPIKLKHPMRCPSSTPVFPRLTPHTDFASHPTMPPPSLLPDELLLLIAEQLPPGDLPNFLRVNSAYHRAGLSVLLKARPSVDLVVADTGNCSGILNPCLDNPRYAAQLKCVALESHSSTFCRNLVLPTLPAVDVIRLYLQSLVPFQYEAEQKFLHDDFQLPQAARRRDEVACPLLRLPYARTLVVAEAVTLEVKGLRDLLPVETAQSIKSAVLFLSPFQTRTGSVTACDPENGDDDEVTCMRHVAPFMPPYAHSFTLVYRSPHQNDDWDPFEDDGYEAQLMQPAYQLIRGIFDLCEDFGRSPELSETIPDCLGTFTIVLPDGVLAPDCAQFLEQQIALSRKQYGAKRIPTVRVLSMLEFMGRDEYAGVMTEEEKKMWRLRAELPHYEMSIEQVKRCVDESKSRWARNRGVLFFHG